MENKISKYCETRIRQKLWLHFLFPEILQPQYFTRAKRFVSEFLETASASIFSVLLRMSRMFASTRPGLGLVILFFFLSQLSRYKIPIVCVWSLTLILAHASQQTQIVITEDWKILTPSNDPGSGNILITVSFLHTHQQDKLFIFQYFFIPRAFYLYIYLGFILWNMKLCFRVHMTSFSIEINYSTSVLI